MDDSMDTMEFYGTNQTRIPMIKGSEYREVWKE